MMSEYLYMSADLYITYLSVYIKQLSSLLGNRKTKVSIKNLLSTSNGQEAKSSTSLSIKYYKTIYKRQIKLHWT